MFPSWPFYLNFIKFLDQYNPNANKSYAEDLS
jgi:hypothetical protein